MRIIELDKEGKKSLLENLSKRGLGQDSECEKTVSEIVSQVRLRGDAALFEYTEKFDKCLINGDNIRVTDKEIRDAYSRIDPEFIEVMKRAAANITAFHEKQKRNSWFDTSVDGSILGQRVTPMETAGVYVPGGKAAYPSSVLMNIIPAKVAGVRRIVICTPPDRSGKVSDGTLVAASIVGASEIYKAGGAQAIAALAFGTGSIPKVDKITGPGNIYVTLAKKLCFGSVSIDSLAGPSEILIIADSSANPRYIAADLLSQAEHDELASAVLITFDKELASQVSSEVSALSERLERKSTIEASLDNYGYIVLVQDLDEAVALANEIAAEHVEILTQAPFEVMPRVTCAGAIFLGEHSPEPLGDYYAGPNHIIPTNGTARFFSPLGVDDFLKKTSIIAYTEEALGKAHKDIELFAEKEGLDAHAMAVNARFCGKVLR